MVWIVLMTAGLLLDICGAFLIVIFFLKFNYKRLPGFRLSPNYHPEYDPLDVFKVLDTLHDFQQDNYDDLYKQSNLIKWGFSFLCVGFTLQIIGNVINYYSI